VKGVGNIKCETRDWSSNFELVNKTVDKMSSWQMSSWQNDAAQERRQTKFYDVFERFHFRLFFEPSQKSRGEHWHLRLPQTHLSPVHRRLVISGFGSDDNGDDNSNDNEQVSMLWNLFLVTDTPDKQARLVVTIRTLQPSLMFEDNTNSVNLAKVGSSITCKY